MVLDTIVAYDALGFKDDDVFQAISFFVYQSKIRTQTFKINHIARFLSRNTFDQLHYKQLHSVNNRSEFERLHIR